MVSDVVCGVTSLFFSIVPSFSLCACRCACGMGDPAFQVRLAIPSGVAEKTNGSYSTSHPPQQKHPQQKHPRVLHPTDFSRSSLQWQECFSGLVSACSIAGRGQSHWSLPFAQLTRAGREVLGCPERSWGALRAVCAWWRVTFRVAVLSRPHANDHCCAWLHRLVTVASPVLHRSNKPE